MLARVAAFAIDGVESRRVTVEADIRATGLPAFTIVGLADKAVRESRDRVRPALLNSGFRFPGGRITVNLAPGYLRKAGPAFDLPLAIALLVGSGQLPEEAVRGCGFAGELSLTGEVEPINGALAVAEGALRHGLRRLVVPLGRAREAALVGGIEVLGVSSLEETVAVLAGAREPAEVPPAPPRPAPDGPDLSDVRGHNALIWAIEVAAAGGHSLFLHGPPGTGKTMLARRLPGLLPPLSHPEALEVTRIHSVLGMHDGSGLIEERPFRSPHHGISAAGLVGGGGTPMPGEITKAHHGVLFLDELPEFGRAALEALRQPLEDGRVVVVRGQRMMVFPTRCMFVAAANPCPCGLGDARCRCTGADLSRYERRLSGPLLDRVDIGVHVGRPTAAEMTAQAAPASATVRERVTAARERQTRRLAGTPAACNAQMTAAMTRHLLDATPAALRLAHDAHDRHGLSARAHPRVLRVARTVADLKGSERVQPEHVAAAVDIRLRTPDEPRALAA